MHMKILYVFTVYVWYIIINKKNMHLLIGNFK